MGKINGAFVMPHPPIIVPFIGKKETEKAIATITAMQKAAKRIADLKPDTIIIISPHGNMFDDYIFMMNERILKGNFHNFDNYEFEERFTNDIDLLSEIIEICRQKDFPAGTLNTELRKQFNITEFIDHGAFVPLYFITREYKKFKLVHISISNFDKRNLYKFGKYVKEAISLSQSNVVIIASGDLSHYLSDDSPYGFRKEGPEFDSEILEIFQNNSLNKIFEIPSMLIDRAGQCGLKSFEILTGLLSDEEIKINVLSYEGPFGIGYMVADMFDRVQTSPYVILAHDAIKYYFDTGMKLDKFDDIPRDMLEKKAGVFVSLKKSGNLRGCIGTLEPYHENIANEIVENAMSAAFKDPRFEPLDVSELESLDISVDVLSEPEMIPDSSYLDPKRYGVIVINGSKRGVLLPDLEGVENIDDQIAIALSKAGIDPVDDYMIERFEVTRYR